MLVISYFFRDDQACKHVAALLFSLWSFTDRHRDRHTEVGTDRTCVWDRPRKESTPLLIDDICIHRKKDVVKPTISSDFQPVLNSTPPNLKRLWKNLALPGSLLSNYLSGDESSEEESLITFFESCRGGWANLGKVVTLPFASPLKKNQGGRMKTLCGLTNEGVASQPV